MDLNHDARILIMMHPHASSSTLGLDVGGANLKAYHSGGIARSMPFAVWKQPERLSAALRELLNSLPSFEVLAVTMTAELCDCFATKREGVAKVLDAVQQALDPGIAARDAHSPKPACRSSHPDLRSVPEILVWQTSGQFVSVEAARDRPFQTAAANWLALAVFAGRFAAQDAALVIDVGSTTTDVIPLRDGVPAPCGRTDPERLMSGELVYSGLRRTPVCALVADVPWRGGRCPVAAEWFATTLDVYLLLGLLAENDANVETADGRSATCRFAHDRIARLIGADGELLSRAEAVRIAEAVAEAQRRQCRRALDQVLRRLGANPKTIVLAGEGETFARGLVDEVWPIRPDAVAPRVISLGALLGADVSQAGCAYALASLAQEKGSCEPNSTGQPKTLG